MKSPWERYVRCMHKAEHMHTKIKPTTTPTIKGSSITDFTGEQKQNTFLLNTANSELRA